VGGQLAFIVTVTSMSEVYAYPKSILHLSFTQMQMFGLQQNAPGPADSGRPVHLDQIQESSIFFRSSLVEDCRQDLDC
jgi:hypothetical protein